MKMLRIGSRLIVIGYILAKYHIDEFILHAGWFYSFRFVSYLNPLRYGKSRKLTRGERLRLALESLGPIFVKFGQMLSTRRDLLPADVAEELSHLQDNVKPFPGVIAKKIIEEALGQPVSLIFREFSQEPLASASVAQVHAATLLTGEEVVVKVLRPNVKQQIENDLEILNSLAKLAHYFLPNGKKLRAQDIVKEFEMSLHAELDLMQEASNAAILRRNFLNSPQLYIPEIFWDYCQKNVLVMERIYGLPISNLEVLNANQINLKILAESVIEVFFTQVFKHNFFHADMHPGNLFVNTSPKGQIIAVDFGIVSSLTESDRRYIAENLLAFFHRDYRKVALLHVESGWVDDDTRITEFEAAIRTASEPVFEKPLSQISMGQLIMNLVRIARNFNIHVQPQLILLQKTLLNVEGLGRTLYPELDLWSTAKPFLEKWLSAQVGPKAFFKKVKENLPFWLEKMPDMPDLIQKALINAQRPQAPMTIIEKVSPKKSRFFLGSGIGLLIGAVLTFALSNHPSPAGWVLFGLGMAALVLESLA